MRNRYLLIAVCFSFLMFSCKVTKKVIRPDIDVPEQLEVNYTDTMSVADMAWWEVFKDTTLQKLIRKTLENNKDFKIASAKVEELAALKRISWAKLLPEANLSIYGQKEGLNYGGDDFKPDPEFAMKGIVNWELDLWGNLRWGKEKGYAEYMVGLEEQRAMKMSLVAQVAELYFELVALDHELNTVRRTLKARGEGVKLAKIRFEGGLTSETSYLQAKLEYARTFALIPDLERKIIRKENEILLLAGTYPNQVEREKMLEDEQLPRIVPVGLTSDLLERRPDVRKAEYQLKVSNAALGIAYTNMFPRISLTSHFGVETDELNALLKSPMYFLSANLLSPLFSFGKNKVQWKAKEAVYKQDCYRYEKTVMAAFYDVKNAIVDFNKMKESYASKVLLLESAKSAMELAQLQYINGVIAYLDVLDAQRSYFDAQVGLSNALRDKQITMVRLYKALGGGWQ